MKLPCKSCRFFPVNNVKTRCNGMNSSAVASQKGITKALSHFTLLTHPLINPWNFVLPFYCFGCNYHTIASGSSLRRRNHLSGNQLGKQGGMISIKVDVTS